jgi:iron complex outermembrane receptor protein
VRGFSSPGDYNTRILLLIDGNRVNDTVYDQAFLGSEFPLDIDMVERVEFIPGQGSAVHGANALFAVVNVVTRRPGTSTGSEVATSIGSGRARQLRVSTNQALAPNSSVLLSATVLRFAGTDAYYPALDTPATNNGISQRTDHERGKQLFAKYHHSDLSATLLHSDRTKGLSGMPEFVFGDPRNLYRDSETLADVSLSRNIDALNRWKLRVYGGSYSFRGDYIIDYPPVTYNQDRAESRWWGVETHLYTERFEAHKLVVGADLHYSPRRDQSNADVSPAAATYLDDRRRGKRQSLFVEDQWTLTQALSVTGGLRYDRMYDAGALFSPRLAVVGRPRDDLVLKFIHGTAFRPPNAYEAYYAIAAPNGYKANPSLRHEKVRGNEFVLELRPTTTTRWTLSAYSNRARDLLSQSVDPADGMLVFGNVGSLRARGVEIEAERVWPSGAQLRANYSAQRVTDPSGQGLDTRAASHLGKVIAILPAGGGWTMGVETVLVDRRAEAAGYGVTNLTLSSAALHRHAVLSLSVYDVFDRQPDDLGSGAVLQATSPQDGRTVRLKLEVKF